MNSQYYITIKCKTIKLLEENTREKSPFDLGFGDDFFR